MSILVLGQIRMGSMSEFQSGEKFDGKFFKQKVNAINPLLKHILIEIGDFIC